MGKLEEIIIGNLTIHKTFELAMSSIEEEILKHFIPISEVEETTTKLIILIEDSLEKDLENYQEAIDIVEKAYIQYKTNKEEEVE